MTGIENGPVEAAVRTATARAGRRAALLPKLLWTTAASLGPIPDAIRSQARK